MKTVFGTIPLILFTSIITACGGGGSGGGTKSSTAALSSKAASSLEASSTSSSSTMTSSSATTSSSLASSSVASSAAAAFTGVFVDSAVGGIGYKTIPGNRTGVTNSVGEYGYEMGDNVIFFIGELEFPAVTAKATVTPLDIANSEDVNNRIVINIARLLQSLDVDGDPENGIRIGTEAISSATKLDFNLPVDQFAALPAIANLLANAGLQQAKMELVSTEVATTHLYNTLANNNLLPPTVCTDTRVYTLTGKDIIAQPDGKFAQTSLTGTLTVQPNNTCNLQVNEGYQGGCQINGTTISALNGGLTGTISNQRVTLLNKAPFASGNSENVSAYIHGESTSTCEDAAVPSGRYAISGSEAVLIAAENEREIYAVTATLTISADSCSVNSSEGYWNCVVSGNRFHGVGDTSPITGTITGNSISYFLPVTRSEDGKYFYGQYSGQRVD